MGCQNTKSDVQEYQNSDINSPINIGGLTLQNRVIVAPLTRCRSDPKNAILNDLMKEYYTQRASYGLILTECSQISEISNAYPGSGGIHNDEQAMGWKKIVDSVHAKGGKIYLQIWHSGRAVLSDFIGGQNPIAPSPIAISTPHSYTKGPYPVPKEMTEQDIKDVIQQFKEGAVRAKSVGFDGVQLHGANGFLVDQFLRDGTNKRTDRYGGSIENRCRFMLEIMDALIEVYGSDRVAIRLSPTGRYNDMYDSNPLELMKYALSQLDKRNLSFVEIKRHGGMDGAGKEDGKEFDDQGRTLPQVQIPDFYKTLRPYYSGVLMANDGFNVESAKEIIKQGHADLVSFGVLSIANPDLPERIQNGWEVNTTVDFDTFFSPGAKGYTDFPRYKQQQQKQSVQRGA